MNLTILLTAFAAFLLALAAHIAAWRFRRPKNQITALAVQMILFPLLILIALCLVPGLREPLSFSEAFNLCVLYLSLAGVYVISFPAAQTFSPTLVIVLQFLKPAPQGLKEDHFKSILKNEDMIPDRIRELTDAKLILRDGNNLTLTPRGKILAGFYKGYRRFLGLPEKGI